MYKEFLGLDEPPFNLTPDPRFLYMSRRHRDALASLIYGIKERKGFIALTGEIGSGKTTLCRAFLRELDPDAINVALVLNSFLGEMDLLRSINDELGISSTAETKKGLIDALNEYLLEENEKGKTTALIIDEAQNLAPAVLEQIRMLGNLETESSKLLQIVLIGQPQLGDLLALPELEQLAQRITVRFHIGPLRKDEIYHYIRHRLHVAGAKINVSLTPAALNRIFNYSKGIPRRINVLCDRALLAAYVAGKFQVDAKMVAESEKELGARRGASLFGLGFFSPGVRKAAALVLGVCVVASLLGATFWAGINWRRPGQALTEIRTADASPSPAPTAVAPTPHPPTPVPVAVPPSPLPAATHTPTAPPAPRDWYYDDDGVARVTDPDFANLAALLTVSNLWKHPVDLEIFRSYERETILGLNVREIFSTLR